MGCASDLTETEKIQILALRDVGISGVKIGEQIGRNQTTVSAFIRKYDLNSITKRTGRKRTYDQRL